VFAAAPAAPSAGWQDTPPMSVPPARSLFLRTAPAELEAGRSHWVQRAE
jgi:hypothetical protein